MAWHEKETITYFDEHAIEGVYFRDGDIPSTEEGLQPGQKFPRIVFPSGDEFEVWATEDPEKGAFVHFFDELDLKYESSRDEAFEDVGKIAEVFEYKVDKIEDNQLEVWSMDEGVVITYDNGAQRIVNAEHFQIPAFEPSAVHSRLLPPDIREQLPPLYAGEKEGLQAKALVKFFTPDSFWSWYASEFDGDDVFFGLAAGFEAELGFFTLSELESVRGSLGLPVERDLDFEPTSLEELLREHRRGR